MGDKPSYDITVTVLDDAASTAKRPRIDPVPLSCAIEAALRRHSVCRACIGLAVADDNEMARLNRAHLDHEGPTDVIAFDMRDNVESDEVEGEIIISAETAVREAEARGHDPAAELALYAVHGVLHLLGYDDHGDEQAERMHEVEDEILGSVGLGPVYGAARR